MKRGQNALVGEHSNAMPQENQRNGGMHMIAEKKSLMPLPLAPLSKKQNGAMNARRVADTGQRYTVALSDPLSPIFAVPHAYTRDAGDMPNVPQEISSADMVTPDANGSERRHVSPDISMGSLTHEMFSQKASPSLPRQQHDLNGGDRGSEMMSGILADSGRSILDGNLRSDETSGTGSDGKSLDNVADTSTKAESASAENENLCSKSGSPETKQDESETKDVQTRILEWREDIHVSIRKQMQAAKLKKPGLSGSKELAVLLRKEGRERQVGMHVCMRTWEYRRRMHGPSIVSMRGDLQPYSGRRQGRSSSIRSCACMRVIMCVKGVQLSPRVKKFRLCEKVRKEARDCFVYKRACVHVYVCVHDQTFCDIKL